jgi:23S rRNA pseudouridine2605 synthase
LNRYLARAGLGSRRGVEEFILAGRVTVNGAVRREPGCRIDPQSDLVALDGQPVRLPSAWRTYAFHKPAGVVSTLKPQGGQPGLALFRTRAGLPPAVVPVGRLDAETTGLLLWTDDGMLAQALLRPASGVEKTYEVRLDGNLAPEDRERLANGVLKLDGRPCRPLRAEPLGPGTRRRWRLTLHEGRKRQIRRMFALLGRRVQSLHRTAVGPVQLGRLRPGDFRRLRESEVASLRRAAGLNGSVPRRKDSPWIS